MRRVEFPAPWKCSLHRNGNPVPERHLFLLHVGSKMERPLWHVVDEYRATRFKNAHAFVNPTAAPLQVVPVLQIILVFAVPIVL